MELGEYVLTLYCDNDPASVNYTGGACLTGPQSCDSHQMFRGRTVGEARKKARAAGWTIQVSEDAHFCPACNKGVHG